MYLFVLNCIRIFVRYNIEFVKTTAKVSKKIDINPLQVKIISYFCIVKRFKGIITALCTVVFAFLTTTAVAQTPGSAQPAEGQDVGAQMKDVKISLLTCSGGKEIWSAFGHTALRVEDPANHLDLVVNWGLFSFRQKFFVVRFAFGRCDYQMGFESFGDFLEEYRDEGRGVIEQDINLTPDEKAAVMRALAENYRDDNRMYRYNFFYDNCTSRARNMIVDHIQGQVDYHPNLSVTTSYRGMVHQWNGAHRWQRFGEDLLLGVGSDRKTDYEQQQFLPDTLRKDFARATILRAGCRPEPLVSATRVVLAPVAPAPSRGFWDVMSPRLLFLLVMLAGFAVSLVEWRRGRFYWGVDFALYLLCGLAGLVLFLMIFSEHPTVRVNLQILVLNPLWLVFLWPALRRWRQGSEAPRWRRLVTVCVILFAIGAFFQDYAEGMVFLALLLLERNYLRLAHAK
jgi:hypothetical protein